MAEEAEFKFIDHTDEEWAAYKQWLRSMPFYVDDKRALLQHAADEENRTLRRDDYLDAGIGGYPGI